LGLIAAFVVFTRTRESAFSPFTHNVIYTIISVTQNKSNNDELLLSAVSTTRTHDPSHREIVFPLAKLKLYTINKSSPPPPSEFQTFWKKKNSNFELFLNVLKQKTFNNVFLYFSVFNSAPYRSAVVENIEIAWGNESSKNTITLPTVRANRCNLKHVQAFHVRTNTSNVLNYAQNTNVKTNVVCKAL